MMTIASRLGCKTFYEYFKSFGLLEKTGIDLPGEGNSIFHAATAFTELDLATASFGQNFKISVLQLICAVSAVANGGHLLTPYLVESITDADGSTLYQHEKKERRVVISKETASTVCDILAGGVYGGATLSRKHSSNVTLNAVSSQKLGKSSRGSVVKALFPSAAKLAGKYKYLDKYPVLLPAAWCDRVINYIRESRRNGGLSEAAKIGEDRIKLLKEYKIID